jgi:uncharacterized protein (TIGR03435 family)
MGAYRWHFRFALFCALLIFLAPGRAAAQGAAAAKYEVASVKPVDPNAPHMVGAKVYPGGRVVITGVSLKALAMIAFQLSAWQVSGGEAWVTKDQYDLDVRPSESLRSSVKNLGYTLFGIEDEHLREMLQAVLADRFELQFHRETKMGDVYLMERNGKPLGLLPTALPVEDTETAAQKKAFGSIGYASARWAISASTAPQLAKFASDYILHAPIIDRTELTGLFDYRQRAPDLDPDYANNSASFLHMLGEIGLKLERSKGPIDSFVIDHAAKPSAN